MRRRIETRLPPALAAGGGGGVADPKTTLVVYMGGGTAASIADWVMSAGLPAATPVAGVTRTGEQQWRGELAALAIGVAQIARGRLPVLVGIGAAFAPLRSADTAMPGKAR